VAGRLATIRQALRLEGGWLRRACLPDPGCGDHRSPEPGTSHSTQNLEFQPMRLLRQSWVQSKVSHYHGPCTPGGLDVRLIMVQAWGLNDNSSFATSSRWEAAVCWRL